MQEVFSCPPMNECGLKLDERKFLEAATPPWGTPLNAATGDDSTSSLFRDHFKKIGASLSKL